MNQPQKPSKIMLLGESCNDIYRFGSVNRISPEAPIPIFDFKHEIKRIGMAQNVYENLTKLGNDVDIYTDVYENKVRYIDHKSNQQLLREDIRIKEVNPIDTSILNLKVDAIVISDYNKGFITYETVDYLKQNFQGPIFIDTKKPDLQRFDGCYVKINEVEYKQRTSNTKKMIATFGGEKVIYQNLQFIPPKVEAHDACGCGDTFIAAFAHQLIRTDDVSKSIDFAMVAAAITVKHLGVYAPSLQEIKNET